MNKSTLALHAAFDLLKNTLHQLVMRGSCYLRRESFPRQRGPQWQQLELPFSRTPVKRWNR